MRRYLRASAVAVPLLIFVAFLLVAAGHILVAVVPLVGAAVSFLAFPYFMTDGVNQQPPPSSPDKGVLPWVRWLAKYAIFMWFMFQPEVSSLLTRIMEGGALLEWKLITPVAVLAIYSVISGLRQASRATDEDIYSYYSTKDDGRQPTSPSA
jgi:hypothetical protein